MSSLEEKKENQEWRCEFCNTVNEVDIDEEEVPKSEAINYIIQAAAKVHDQKRENLESSIVLCIDISGSMCVTIPIQGRHQIKNDRHQELMNEFMKFSDGSDQFLQGERGVTYVSRLQCVQSALE